MTRFDLILLLLSHLIHSYVSHETGAQSCSAETHSCDHKYGEELNRNDNLRRFLIYDQNFGEGFNLRRDVYIRMALLVSQLGPHWTLVLPKWSLLPHWKRKNDEKSIQWKSYFDVQSLNRFIPVIEFTEFVILEDIKSGYKTPIDVVLSLENFEDTFESNDWTERHDLKECNQTKHFGTIDSRIVYLYERSDQFVYKSLFCLKIEGFLSTLRQVIVDRFSDVKTVFISNAEVIVNDKFGSKDYWNARRSMRFNENLISIANQFRKEYLNSDDISDKTVIDNDWMSMKRTHGHAVGGPYLSVHLRRGDFAKWRQKDVPDLDCAVKQIDFALRTFSKTNNVFIASDANPEEWSAIERLFANFSLNLFRFQSSELTDGQIAIIDQWIASHAILFIGTYESTFSFRIQEEREILGFSPNTTFNSLCPKCEQQFRLCQQESQWKIVY